MKTELKLPPPLKSVAALFCETSTSTSDVAATNRFTRTCLSSHPRHTPLLTYQLPSRFGTGLLVALLHVAFTSVAGRSELRPAVFHNRSRSASRGMIAQ